MYLIDMERFRRENPELTEEQLRDAADDFEAQMMMDAENDDWDDND